MSSLQNRIDFGAAVLSRLDAATLAGVKEERETFREKHDALLAVRRATEGVVEGDPSDPPAALFHAWDAALRRLTDGVRRQSSPAALAELFAPPGKTTMATPAPKKTTGKKSKAPAPTKKPPADAKTPKGKTKTKASAKPPTKTEASKGKSPRKKPSKKQ